MTAQQKLPGPIMAGIQKEADSRFGEPELLIPQMELVTPTQGRNKGKTRAEYVKDPASGELNKLILTARPGQNETLYRLGMRF